MVSIEPIKTPKYISKQSPSPHLPKLPVRMIVSGQSGAGKGVTVQNLLLRPQLYRNCFDRIYYFSASASVDSNLVALKEFCEDLQDDPCVYDEWIPSTIDEIIDRQAQDIEKRKKMRSKTMPNIAIVCDDFADTRSAMHGSTLKKLFLRGRHYYISTFVLTQKYRLLDNSLRINATALLVFRCRSMQDKEAVLHENAALIGYKSLEELYNYATSEPYQFLYIDLMGADTSKMFYKGFLSKLVIE